MHKLTLAPRGLANRAVHLLTAIYYGVLVAFLRRQRVRAAEVSYCLPIYRPQNGLNVGRMMCWLARMRHDLVSYQIDESATETNANDITRAKIRQLLTTSSKRTFAVAE